MDPISHSELDMFPLFEKTPDLVCIAGKDGYFKRINQSVIDKLGYTKAELFGNLISSFIHPDDKELTSQLRIELLNGKPLVNFQNRYLTKNNNIIWLDWTSVYFTDKEIVFAIAKDVTERKLLEKEVENETLKFKNLASHFKKSIEKDRKYFAVELHEEVAQLAAVIKMDIDWIQFNSTDLSDFLKGRVEHALEVSNLLINTIKRISFSVSPDILADHGLNETLHWLCKEFTLLNGIPCEYINNCNEEGLSNEVSLDFFRICQESLNNISRHANAKQVTIKLTDNDKGISLAITDDGDGFDLNANQHSFGLTNMRELVSSINGRLTIDSSVGKGTQVRVDVDRSFSIGQSSAIATPA